MIKECFLDFMNGLDIYLKSHYTGGKELLWLPNDAQSAAPEECGMAERPVAVKKAAVRKTKQHNVVTASSKSESLEETCVNLCSSDDRYHLASLDDLLHRKQISFSEKLFTFILDKGLKDVDVYTSANLDRRHFSKLRRRDYTPGKSTVLALIIAMELDMSEAKELLSYAGYAINPNNPTDVIVSYFIEQEMYDIRVLNEVLNSYGQNCLGNVVK